MNTWPKGYRHAMHQSEHESWNSWNYPGTRQLCALCESPTRRCEEDSLRVEGIADNEPICEECYSAAVSVEDGKNTKLNKGRHEQR